MSSQLERLHFELSNFSIVAIIFNLYLQFLHVHIFNLSTNSSRALLLHYIKKVKHIPTDFL